MIPQQTKADLEKRRLGKLVVLATGVFDLLHAEHKTYLRAAKNAGDLLVVAIESDVRTRELKGEGRPIQNQDVRLQAVLSLDDVDVAFILPEDFRSQEAYESLMEELRPDIYACSSSSPYMENKKQLVEKFGGELRVVHQHNPEVSTSKILEAQRKNDAANNKLRRSVP